MAPKTKAKAKPKSKTKVAAPRSSKPANKPVKLAPLKAQISDPLSKVLKVTNTPKGVNLNLSLPSWLSPEDILAIVTAIGEVLQKWITQLVTKPGK